MQPKLHLHPPRNWANDPVGLIHYGGQYHVFYQYFPYATRWGTMHWRHATSPDLVHFEDQDIALFPSQYDDANGCFSGSAIEKDGKMRLYYTGVRYTKPKKENIHVNESGRDYEACQMMIDSPDGMNFDNFHDKSLIIEAGAHGDRTDTRDPMVFKIGDDWYMVLASRYIDEEGKHQGQLLFYVSPDSENWVFRKAYRGIKLGDMWECPNVFPVDEEQWALIFSPERTEAYGYPSVPRMTLIDFEPKGCDLTITGDLQLLDEGRDLYAPQVSTDAEGRKYYIGWMRMPEPVNGWRGMFSFPRLIEEKAGRLITPIHPNADAQFTEESTFDPNVPCKITVDLHEGQSINIGGYFIKYKYGCLLCDRQEVYPDDGTGAPFVFLKDVDPCHLDIYVDQPLIEVFVNGGERVVSSIVYDLHDTIESMAPYTLLISAEE